MSNDNDKTPEAMAHEIEDVVTGAIAAAEERGRRPGVTADGMQAAILGRCAECQKPLGPLGNLAEKVNKLNRSVLLATGAILLLGAALPYIMHRIEKRMDVLDVMTVQITTLQVQVANLAAHAGHTQGEPFVPKSDLAVVSR